MDDVISLKAYFILPSQLSIMIVLKCNDGISCKNEECSCVVLVLKFTFHSDFW